MIGHVVSKENLTFPFQLDETASSSSAMAAMVKKPRLSSEGASSAAGVLLPPPPPGALPLPPPPPTHTTPEQYGVYLYNMAVATKNPAMAAWAASFANAIKVSGPATSTSTFKFCINCLC